MLLLFQQMRNGVITPKRNTPDRPVVVPIKPPIVDKINASNKN